MPRLLVPLLLAPLPLLLPYEAQGFLLQAPALVRTAATARWRSRPPLPVPLRSSSSNGTPQQPSASPSLSYRQVALVKRFARLPFWPIWHGLLIMLLDQVWVLGVTHSIKSTICGHNPRLQALAYMYTPIDPRINANRWACTSGARR